MSPTYYDDDEEIFPPELGSDDEDEGASGAWRRFEQFVPDVVRRTLLAGVGAVFMTEEGLRATLGDLKLPKEAVAYLMGQAERSKRELTQALARELRSFLDDVDITGVLRRVLSGMTVEFRTEVRFIPNADHLEPQVSFEKVERDAPAEAEEGEAKPPAAKTRAKRKASRAPASTARRRKQKEKKK